MRVTTRAHAATMRLAAVIGCAAALACGCSKRPDDPAHTNPFDPDGDGGDPFSLSVSTTTGAVNLSWRAVPIEGRRGYAIYRRTYRDAGFVMIDTTGLRGYRDDAPVLDAFNAYLVRVVAADGEESAGSSMDGDSIEVAALLHVGTRESGVDTTSARCVLVRLFSERADSVFLADSLAGGELFNPSAFAADSAGYTFCLSRGVPASGKKTVRGRIKRTDGRLSPISSGDVQVRRLSLVMEVNGESSGPVVTGRREVDVRFESADAESLEVTFDSTFAGAWEPFAPKRTMTLPGPEPALLQARALNAFGAVATTSISIEPDLLDGAGIVINGNASQTALCSATVEVVGGEVFGLCLSNRSDAECLDFAPYTGALIGWPLEPCDNVATIYARFSNDWVSAGTAPRAASIFVLGRSLSIGFVTPSPAGTDTLVLGETAPLTGRGIEGACGGMIDSITLDVHREAPTDTLVTIGVATLGAPAEGDTADVGWSFDWAVPGPGPDWPDGAAEIIARSAACAETVSVHLSSAASRPR